jgi:hypothetical protein
VYPTLPRIHYHPYPFCDECNGKGGIDVGIPGSVCEAEVDDGLALGVGTFLVENILSLSSYLELHTYWITILNSIH